MEKIKNVKIIVPDLLGYKLLNQISRSFLKGNEFKLYSYFVEISIGKGYSWPNYNYICKENNLAKEAYSNNLTSLKQKGLVHVKQFFNKSTKNYQNLYFLKYNPALQSVIESGNARVITFDELGKKDDFKIYSKIKDL